MKIAFGIVLIIIGVTLFIYRIKNEIPEGDDLNHVNLRGLIASFIAVALGIILIANEFS